MLILEDSQIGEVKIKIVRDDLYPGIGGGNKCRKAEEYEKDVECQGCDTLVTTGGVQSNHCRAIALLAAKRGWRCHIVYHGTRERFEREKGNALLVRLSGASVEFVEADEIGPAMDEAMARFRAEGRTPYYVTGGGHDLPGGVAYVKAMAELKETCVREGWIPDYIFLASGTGSTQGGIVVGKVLNGWKNTRVVGISVARRKARGEDVIRKFVDGLACHYDVEMDAVKEVEVRDDYLFGGYEGFTPEMKRLLENVAKETGLILDTTYSGKAFYGMLDVIRQEGLEKANVLFWHTGGLMNIQA